MKQDLVKVQYPLRGKEHITTIIYNAHMIRWDKVL